MGEYCNKVGNKRNNRKKLIYYNYKQQHGGQYARKK